MIVDGDKPATKSALQAVRSELKSDLQAVRSELKEDIKRVAVEVVNTQGQIRQMEERLDAKMDTRFNQVLNSIDAFAKKSEINSNAVVLHGRALTDVQVGLKDHEKRLKTLESARP